MFNAINDIFNKNKKTILVYLFLSFACCFMSVYRILSTGQMYFLFMVWNLFLTWIPYGLALLVGHLYATLEHSSKKTLLITLIGGFWLLFYPNAPYIITDYLHLNSINFYKALEPHFSYNSDLLAWYDFVMMSLYVLTGFLLGFLSLNIIHGIVNKKYGNKKGWLFVLTVQFVSSYAIYLGRFIRLNSWDLFFAPATLFGTIIKHTNMHSLSFTFIFGLFLTLIYLALNELTYKG